MEVIPEDSQERSDYLLLIQARLYGWSGSNVDRAKRLEISTQTVTSLMNGHAESFFATFKKRVTQKKIYATRDEARGEIFNFIEMFYNPVKRHSHTGGVSPAKFEADYFSRLEGVY